MLRLGDGAHLHWEITKQKEKKGSRNSPFAKTWWWRPLAPRRRKNQKTEKEGELELLFYPDLALVPRKQQNKWKKGEQAPFLPNLGDGVLKITQKIMGTSSPFVKS
jgi:hypothetical protein